MPCSPSAVALEMWSLCSLFLFTLSLLAWLSCQWQKVTRDLCLPLPACANDKKWIYFEGNVAIYKTSPHLCFALEFFLIFFYYCFYCPFLSVSKEQRYLKHLPRWSPPLWNSSSTKFLFNALFPFLKYKAEGNWKHLKGALLCKAFVCLKTSFFKLPL